MFGWLRKKNALTTISVDQIADIAGFVRYGTSSGITVTPVTAVEVSAVLCAVKVIAEGIAQMPIRVMRESYTGDNVVRQIDREFWAHKLLARRPNQFQTSYEFREYAITAALLDSGFLGIKNIVGGEVKEILPLPMGSWSIHRNDGEWSHYFRVGYANGTTGDFLPSQCIYLRGPSLDGWRALPALKAAQEAIGLAKAIEKQQARLAGNGGKPSGVLTFDETLKPDTRDKLKELWQEKFGPNGEGGIAVLDRSAKFQSMTMTSVDAQHLETRRFQIEEVARAFRVQPIMLMHSNATTTFASAEQHFRNHVIHTLGPWMVRLEQVLNRDVLNHDMTRRVDLDERALLRGDFKDQAEYYTKALGSGGQPGWMTVNEIRSERDMNPVQEEWANTVPRGAMNPAQPNESEDDGL
jgi:HK97 family phage portal protein